MYFCFATKIRRKKPLKNSKLRSQLYPARDSNSFARRHQPLAPRIRHHFGSCPTGNYALNDFVDSMHIHMLENQLKKMGFEDHQQFLSEPMNAKRMAEFLYFLSSAVLDSHNWDAFRKLLQIKMEEKCRFYYKKVVQISEKLWRKHNYEFN